MIAEIQCNREGYFEIVMPPHSTRPKFLVCAEMRYCTYIGESMVFDQSMIVGWQDRLHVRPQELRWLVHWRRDRLLDQRR
jgi:hypothetical protein